MKRTCSPLILGLAFSALLLSSSGFAFEDPGLTGYSFQGQPEFLLSAIQDRTTQGENRPMLAQGPVSPGPSAGSEPGAIEEAMIADPLEPLNRAFYKFNDRLYFWVLKPAAKGYKAVVPEPARVGVKNFFYNLAFPIRFVNCAFQGKVRGAADEFGRFMVNSIFGVAGFMDVIPKDIKRYNEDLGQTFGVYGIGPGFYLVLPFLGPSTLRDGIGRVGDGFLNPVNYIVSDIPYNVAVRGYETVNDASLTLGDYEAFKRAALDPYIALRSAYYENRLSLIKD